MLVYSQARNTKKDLFYTHGSHISHMSSTAAEIEAALPCYRKVSAERNKRLLGVCIDAITEAKSTDELIREEESDEDWKEEQVNSLRDLVDAELDYLGMFKPTDLLYRFDRFAAALKP